MNSVILVAPQHQCAFRLLRWVSLVACATLWVAGCSRPGAVVSSSLAPTSQTYREVHIEVNESLNGTAVTATFTSREGIELRLDLSLQGDALVLSRGVPAAGITAGQILDGATLRTILVESDIVAAGQFKVLEGERTVSLITQVAKSKNGSFELPASFERLPDD